MDSTQQPTRRVGVSMTGEEELKLPHAVIQFKRSVDFPRFSMRSGERWSFVVYGKWADRLARLKAGDRFDFAGGQCLAQDVELIYEGPCDINYSIAAGHIKPERVQKATLP